MKKKKINTQYSTIGAIDSNVSAPQTQFDKFDSPQGHGFAAEQANNLYDILTGKKATVIGGDNAKDGADRLVNGIYIQTKYCQTATDSVQNAFDKGQYRYLNPDGSLMQLEVPSDQYQEAVKLMSKRIERGQVQGVSDPNDAKNIVREGHFTYEQAKNIAKFGTVESISFDATNGVVIGTSAFGISAVMTFATTLWSGESIDIAFEDAICSGLKMGGVAFLNTVITSQLMRTGLNEALTNVTDSIVGHLGNKTSEKLANALVKSANVTGEQAMVNLSKLLRGTIVSNGVMVVLLSAKDISNSFRGRISGKQLFKNITTKAAGVTGGSLAVLGGQLLLTIINPAAGAATSIVVSVVSGVIGGTVSETATNKIIGHFVEDDAVALVNIIEEKFIALAQKYLLSSEEVEICLADLQDQLTNDVLMDMYASDDHEIYAETLVRKIIEHLVIMRCRVCLPSYYDFYTTFAQLIDKAENGNGVIHPAETKSIDHIELGKALTGKEYSERAAKKGVYVAKQCNMVSTQTQLHLQRLANLANDNPKTSEELDKLKVELDSVLNEF